MDSEFVEKLSVAKLLRVCNNAFVIPIWMPRQIVTREGVRKCIESGSMEHPEKFAVKNQICSIAVHTARIAWLVVNGWNTAIDVDFGIPNLGYSWYPLLDGHHRLAAAFYRNDSLIDCAPSGAISEIFKYRP